MEEEKKQKDIKVSELVEINLRDIVRCEGEEFFDMLAEKTGYPLLTDITYEVDAVDMRPKVGNVSGETYLTFRVNGYVEEEE